MSLVIPFTLLVIGAIGLILAYFLDREFRGIGVVVGLFSIAVLGLLAGFGYGAFSWLREGEWGAIRIIDILELASRFGIDLSVLTEPVSWQGITKLGQWYLESNVGWTIFWIPLILVLGYFQLTDRVED